jgi:hypothetical protein
MEYQMFNDQSLCCKRDPIAIKWNPFNKVIQCHQCGHIWVPVDYMALIQPKTDPDCDSYPHG